MSILVLGMHRSGTSVVTRLINLMGAYVGEPAELVGASAENPKGFWERQDVIACNDSILAQGDCRWDSLAGWEERKPSVLPDALDHTIRGIIGTLNSHQPWVLKDPRLCLTLPYWLAHMESPVTVLVRRDPLEIAESLRIRNGFHLPHGLALWEYYWCEALNSTRRLPRIFIDYAEAVADPIATAKRLYESLKAHAVSGLHPAAQDEVHAFVEPELYRSKPKDWPPSQTLTAYQRQLAEYKGDDASEEAFLVSPWTKEVLVATREHVRTTAEIRTQAERLREQTVRLEDFERHVLRQNEELAQQHQHIIDYQGQVTAIQRDKAVLQDKIAQLEPYVERYHVATSEIAFMRASRAWRIGSWLTQLGSRALRFLPGFRKSNSLPSSPELPR